MNLKLAIRKKLKINALHSAVNKINNEVFLIKIIVELYRESNDKTFSIFYECELKRIM